MAFEERQVVSLDNENRGLPGLVVCVIFVALATVATGLRVLSKRMLRLQLAADDYWVIAALIFSYGLLATTVLAIVGGGVGLHAKDLTPHQLILSGKALTASEIIWALTLTSLKISILIFYIRIFVIKPFRVTAYVFMAIVVAWAISVILEDFFLCRPFSYNWNPEQKGTCGNRTAAFLGAGCMNIIIDVIILCLPMPMVWNLQIPRANKIALTLVFGLGSAVCVISVLRILSIKTVTFLDITYTEAESFTWSLLEPTLGIICACLPTMRPLFNKVFPERLTNRQKPSPQGTKSSDGKKGWSGWMGSGQKSSSLESGPTRDGSKFQRLEDDDAYPLTELGSTIDVGKPVEGNHVFDVEALKHDGESDTLPGAISVKTEFCVQRS